MKRTIDILISVAIMMCGIVGIVQCWQMPDTQAALSVCAGVALGFGVGNTIRLLR